MRGVTRFNAKEDRRHDRRTLALDELRKLIDAAAIGPDFQRMTGPGALLSPGRRLGTALPRAGQFDPRVIRLPDRPWRDRGRRLHKERPDPATLPLPDDLADELAAFLASLTPGAPVFPLPAEKGAKMLRTDLAAAGIPYRGAAGPVFDFHSLRCQCATLADAASVSPRVVQRMMRHSTLELTNRYTRPRAVDMEAAALMLPSLKPEAPSPEPMAATGTDPAPVFEPIPTRGATRPEGGQPNPLAGKHVLATGQRSHNPHLSLIERTSETRRDEMNLFGISQNRLDGLR